MRMILPSENMLNNKQTPPEFIDRQSTQGPLMNTPTLNLDPPAIPADFQLCFDR